MVQSRSFIALYPITKSLGIFRINKNYIVAVAGKGKSHLQVKGPHEQIVRIIDISLIEGSDILLLRAEKDIIFNRYVKYLTLTNK